MLFVIFNFFDLTYYFDDVVQLPLWIHIFVGVFICATILWALLIAYGFRYFVYQVIIERICNSKDNSRIQNIKKSLGITENILSIEPDGTDEISRHTYTHISMRKPCEHMEKFEIRNHNSH